jgi:hypothetical protein
VLDRVESRKMGFAGRFFRVGTAPPGKTGQFSKMAVPPDRASAPVNAADSPLAVPAQTHDRSASMSNWNRTKPTTGAAPAGSGSNTALAASSPGRPLVSSSPSNSTSSGMPQSAGSSSSAASLSASTGAPVRVSGDEQIRIGTTESASKHTRDASRSQVAVQMLAVRTSLKCRLLFSLFSVALAQLLFRRLIPPH